MALYLVLGTEGSPAAAGDRYPATDAGIRRTVGGKCQS